MAIYKNNKKVIGVYKGTTPVLNIYRGGKLVFGEEKEYQIIVNADNEVLSSSTLYLFNINGDKYYYHCRKGINKWDITNFTTYTLTDLTRFILQTNFTDLTLQNIDVSNVAYADSMITSSKITGNVTLRNLSFDKLKTVNNLINATYIQSLRFENVNFPALNDITSKTFISINNLTDIYIDSQSFTNIDKSLFEGQHNYFMYKTNDTPLTIHCTQKFKNMIDSSTNKGGLGNYYDYITWDIIQDTNKDWFLSFYIIDEITNDKFITINSVDYKLEPLKVNEINYFYLDELSLPSDIEITEIRFDRLSSMWNKIDDLIFQDFDVSKVNTGIYYLTSSTWSQHITLRNLNFESYVTTSGLGNSPIIGRDNSIKLENVSFPKIDLWEYHRFCRGDMTDLDLKNVTFNENLDYNYFFDPTMTIGTFTASSYEQMELIKNNNYGGLGEEKWNAMQKFYYDENGEKISYN